MYQDVEILNNKKEAINYENKDTINYCWFNVYCFMW